MKYHFDSLPTRFEIATRNNNWDIAIFVQPSSNRQNFEDSGKVLAVSVAETYQSIAVQL